MPVEDALLNDCVVLQMTMNSKKLPHWRLRSVVFFGLFVWCFSSDFVCSIKMVEKLTYFGDSGVKGSGKVVGLAVEHKGAWVIN